MASEQILFYLFSSLIVIFSLCVVLCKNILHAAMALIASFFATAFLYLLLNFEFVALAQIMVYIGGVLIFMVFAVLLTSFLGDKYPKISFPKRMGALFFSGLAFLSFWKLLAKKEYFASIQTPTRALESNFIAEIGEKFLSYREGSYVLAFELSSLLLLAVVIGSTLLAKKEEEGV